MKRILEHHPNLDGLRVVYADLDGTLLGPGGSLFSTPGGLPSLRAASAVEALHRAGVWLVLVSGRTRRGMLEPARVLGARAYIAELGALLVEQLTPEEVVVENFGAFRGPGTPFEEMARSGAGGYLLERYPGRLEPHTPWTTHVREATMLFRGLVDPREATDALADAAYGWLALHDNGRLATTPPTLDVPETRAYHLTPRGVSKASAVRLHRERHGIGASEAAGVGDSASDVAVAAEVGAFFVVANGVASLEGAREPGNVFATPSSHGDGFAEAIAALLPG